MSKKKTKGQVWNGSTWIAGKTAPPPAPGSDTTTDPESPPSDDAPDDATDVNENVPE
jgi:hypothetical protein